MADGVKAVKEDSPLRRSTRRRNGATVCTFLESNNRPTESANDVCLTRHKGIDQLLKRMVSQRLDGKAKDGKVRRLSDPTTPVVRTVLLSSPASSSLRPPLFPFNSVPLTSWQGWILTNKHVFIAIFEWDMTCV